MVSTLKDWDKKLNKWWLVLLSLVVVNSALAQQIKATSGPYRTPVVELYTSEGCSSCPPADEWISKLGRAMSSEFHAVPLAFHVDYWNRLGWPDPYSDSEFTKRQQQHAVNNRQRSIYTPEFLVSGKETRGTSAVVEHIKSANTELAEVLITFGVMPLDSGDLVAELLVENSVSGAELYLAIFENNIVRQIEGGENKGRTLHHDFVVRHWVKVATLQSGAYEGAHEITMDDKWNTEEIGFAAVVIDPATGDTLQALSSDLGPLFNADS